MLREHKDEILKSNMKIKELEAENVRIQKVLDDASYNSESDGIKWKLEMEKLEAENVRIQKVLDETEALSDKIMHQNTKLITRNTVLEVQIADIKENWRSRAFQSDPPLPPLSSKEDNSKTPSGAKKTHHLETSLHQSKPGTLFAHCQLIETSTGLYGDIRELAQDFKDGSKPYFSANLHELGDTGNNFLTKDGDASFRSDNTHVFDPEFIIPKGRK